MYLLQWMVQETHDLILVKAFPSLSNAKTQSEIDHYWNKLTEEGTEVQCGWLKDKFGVSWQIVPTILESLMNDPAKSSKVNRSIYEK